MFEAPYIGGLGRRNKKTEKLIYRKGFTLPEILLLISPSCTQFAASKHYLNMPDTTNVLPSINVCICKPVTAPSYRQKI